MQNTENYKLKKPESTDFYNVDDFNSNFDLIDTELKKLSDSVGDIGNIDLTEQLKPYAKTAEVDAKLESYAKKDTVYTKQETYSKTETYTKQETDNAINTAIQQNITAALNASY